MAATAVPEGLSVWWWSALAAGAAVAVVVVILLHTLLRLVTDIERGLAAIWEAGKQVARNTATTWMLKQTGRLLDEVNAEAKKHDAFLARRR